MFMMRPLSGVPAPASFVTKNAPQAYPQRGFVKTLGLLVQSASSINHLRTLRKTIPAGDG